MKKYQVLLVVLFTILIMSVFFPRHTTPVTEEERLAAYAYAASVGKPLPPFAFSSDGCTFWPDRFFKHDFSKACLEHDISYWLGGTSNERLEADLAFKAAITHTGALGRPLAPLMFWATRTFGDSWLTRLHNANWGYGYNHHELPF